MVFLLRYFTTYNVLLICLPYIRKRHGRALLALNLSVAIPTAGMLVVSIYQRRTLKWKGRKISMPLYLFLELIVHQVPLCIALGLKASGNVSTAILPVGAYCASVKNPYSVGKWKLNNKDAFCILALTLPLTHMLRPHVGPVCSVALKD